MEELHDEISVFWMRGKPKAVSTICPHFGGEFDYDCDKEILRCQWHGWKFDLNTGKSLAKADLYEEQSLIGKILKTAKEPLGCFPFKGKLQEYNLIVDNENVSIVY
jgi:nitrite reductase/ring-hydroxylating ferredoxin subunit